MKHGSISCHTVLGISQPIAACRVTVAIKCDLQTFKLYKSSPETIAAGSCAPSSGQYIVPWIRVLIRVYQKATGAVACCFAVTEPEGVINYEC